MTDEPSIYSSSIYSVSCGKNVGVKLFGSYCEKHLADENQNEDCDIIS